MWKTEREINMLTEQIEQVSQSIDQIVAQQDELDIQLTTAQALRATLVEKRKKCIK